MLKRAPMLAPIFAVPMFIAAAMPAVAQSVDATAATEQHSLKGLIATGAPAHPTACVEYIAEYMGCLHYSAFPEAHARTAHGRLFVEVQTPRTTLVLQPSAAPDRGLHASRIASPRR